MIEVASDKLPHPEPVETVRHPYSLEEFRREHVLRRRPVVIRTSGPAELGWRTERWTTDYLVERAGEVPVLVQLRQGGVFSPVRGAGTHQRMSFADFVHRVMEGPEGDESLYLNVQDYGQQVGPPLDRLQEDFSVPEYFRHMPLRWVNLWMGRTAGAAHSQLHHDYHDNLYCVVSGRKHFVVFPPTDAPCLYTRGRPLRIEPNGLIHYAPEQRARQPHFSLVNTQRVDPGRFPRYRQTRPASATIEPGDLLFLPAGWFHEVRSEGAHIAINFWADPPSSEQVSPDY